MSFFQQICDAAKNKDEALLGQYFDEGACIDEREKSLSFTSPAGRLAIEGDINSATFLVNKFGASVEFVVDGLLKGGYEVEASALMKQYKITKGHCPSHVYQKDGKFSESHCYDTAVKTNKFEQKDQLRAAVVTGDMDYVAELQNLYRRTVSEEDFINYAAHGGHLFLIEKMYSRSHKLTKDFAYWLNHNHAWHPIGYQTSRFMNAELALHSLSFISNQRFLRAIVDKLILHSSTMTYNIEEIVEKSRKIHYIMETEKTDYVNALQQCDSKIVTLEPLKNSSRFLRFFEHSHSVHVKTNEEGRNIGVIVHDDYKVKCSIL